MRAKPAPINTESATAAADGTFLVAGHPVAAPKATPGLYLVATPIGNLRDITLRALETLAGVDIIACEDTRITRRLTERYGIKTELTPYHEHNAAIARASILARLAQGASVALVSDAGTPLVSDPGFKLARIDATIVIFETGSRIREALADLAEILGAREAAICRELTKIHEEVARTTLAEFASNARGVETRGEFVLVIGPPHPDARELTNEALDDLLRGQLKHQSVKDAVAHAVELSGRPRREVYARALELAKKDKRAGR